MVSELADKECVPCRGGTPPLPGHAVRDLLRALDGWTVAQAPHLTRPYHFPAFT